jgi:uncharacterized spore protein YtfJ
VQVIGEPVNIEGKVIIPAVVARVGFGAGGGGGTSPAEDEAERAEGSGGGGGGAAVMTPVFLIVDDDGERLLTVPGPFGQACSIVEKAKSALDRVMPRKDAPETERGADFDEDLPEDIPGEDTPQ